MPAMRNTNTPHSRAFRGQTAAAGRRITILPAEGCALPVPPVPAQVRGVWTAQQKRRWKELWQSPQATQWDESCAGTVALLVQYESQLLSGDGTAWVGQEARYASDALGLTPKSMNALGWRIADVEGLEEQE